MNFVEHASELFADPLGISRTIKSCCCWAYHSEAASVDAYAPSENDNLLRCTQYVSPCPLVAFRTPACCNTTGACSHCQRSRLGAMGASRRRWQWPPIPSIR